MGFYQLFWASLAQLFYPSSLQLMGLPSTPYFLWLHYFGLAMAHSHFSTSHTAHEFDTSLSSGSFRSICFLKTHLFMSWACDPLLLPYGLNGFSIYLLTLFCPFCPSFFFSFAGFFEQWTLTCTYVYIFLAMNSVVSSNFPV